MKIESDLNILLTVEVDDQTFVAHSTPVSKIYFEANWKLLRAFYDELTSGGSLTGSLSLARLILLDVAESIKKRDGAQELLNILGSTTFVSVEGGAPQLLDSAKIDDDVKDEIINKLLFFIVGRRHLLSSQKKEWESIMTEVLNISFTSSPYTALSSSSTTAIVEDSIIVEPTETQSIPI